MHEEDTSGRRGKGQGARASSGAKLHALLLLAQRRVRDALIGALRWLRQVSCALWKLLADGGEIEEGCSKLRRQEPGAGTGRRGQQENESLTRGRARGIWACTGALSAGMSPQAGVEETL